VPRATSFVRLFAATLSGSSQMPHGVLAAALKTANLQPFEAARECP